eukprot:CAMPEP_0196590210 /NCGR_PEP_ID=MMETSP1081-20130531/65972_1 /TAXON_ID=36882 /ORGANISM="Pyramimonas amylifera, Strain CCMP720" /LENGTH=360 /DNA_ID=CAMNT_0041913249 /DNA_START=243 /DNA_END=1325 /DNA_ORIENTATION=+
MKSASNIECYRPTFGSTKVYSTLSSKQNGRVVFCKANNNNKDSLSEDEGEAAASVLAKIVANPLFYIVAGIASIKLVASLDEQVGVIVLLSALPVVGLTLISKSDAGKKVEEALKEKLPELEAAAADMKEEQASARERSPWYGPNRPKFLGPLEFDYPTHLEGQLAGDYGFDPLDLGKKPEDLAKYSEAELLHARWAMLGAIGALIPEVLAMNGVDLGEPIWWKVGYEKLTSDLTLNYAGIEGFRIAGKQGLWIIAACQLFLMGGPEYARYVGIKSLEPVGIFLPGTVNYPGSPLFDPLKLSDDADRLVDQAVIEIKHGRIAMLTMLGYYVQAIVTQKGPVENLLDFIADPMHNNLFLYL